MAWMLHQGVASALPALPYPRMEYFAHAATSTVGETHIV
jgi:hypothetical protein